MIGLFTEGKYIQSSGFSCMINTTATSKKRNCWPFMTGCWECRNYRKYPEIGVFLNGTTFKSEDFGHGTVDVAPFAQDGDQEINDDRDQDLDSNGVFALVEKCLDSQMMFDPFEKYLNFPAFFTMC